MFPRISRFIRLTVGVICLFSLIMCYLSFNNNNSSSSSRSSNNHIRPLADRRHLISRQASLLLVEQRAPGGSANQGAHPLSAIRPDMRIANNDGVKVKNTVASFNTSQLTKNQASPSRANLPFDAYVRRKLAHVTFRKPAPLNAEKPHPYPPSKVINPHDFSYIHNPSGLCQGRNISFLIYIHSSPSNMKKRLAIRHTWGHPKLLSLYNATLVFLLGKVPLAGIQGLVDMESEKYGDIVQEDFQDSYRNLTLKGMAALRWACTFCRHASFLLKSDDDILIDFVSYVDYVVNKVFPTHGQSELVLCNLWTNMKPMREPKSKWFLSKQEFPLDVFPPYCSGSAFLVSSDLVPKMYHLSLQTRFFWVDDYFISGQLVNQLKVRHVSFNSVYLLNYNVVEDRLANDTGALLVFHVKKLSTFLKVWPYLSLRHPGMAQYLSSSSSSLSAGGIPRSAFTKGIKGVWPNRTVKMIRWKFGDKDKAKPVTLRSIDSNAVPRRYQAT